MFPPQQLDQLVARIALYPDPLLAQVMAAATYPNDIPPAAQWADQHHYLTGQQLADAIQGDQLPWDPSVQSLLPFPSVLDMMNSDMRWTTDLGNAFLAQQQEVMDAVQRQRAVAQRYGYLRSNGQVMVSGGPYITITPVNPGYVVVPYYDPTVVFYAPRPGFFVGGGIRFGYGVNIGGFFAPWGWGGVRFDWGGHGVFLNGARWDRRWDNRALMCIHIPRSGVPDRILCAVRSRIQLSPARCRNEMRHGKAVRRLANPTTAGAAENGAGNAARSLLPRCLGRYRENGGGRPLRSRIVG